MILREPELLAALLQNAPDGIAVVEAVGGTLQLSYLNSALAALLGQPEATLLGRALEDIEIEAPVDPNATNAGVGQRVRLRRLDGSFVDCERWTVVLPAGQLALYFRPLSRGAPGAPAVVDRASGLSTAEHLQAVLQRDWAIGQRDGRALTLMRFDVDAYRDYQDVFGRVATENMLRQLGRTIGSAMRRTSDVVARLGDDEFVALGVAMAQPAAVEYAEVIVGRIRALAIHHPRSRIGRFVTVSAGVVTTVPPRDCGCEALLEAAQRALARAKQAGGNRAAGGEF